MLGGIGTAKKGAKRLRGFRNPEPNTSPVPKSSGHPLSCFTWPLWLGQSPSVVCASSPVWGQEETRIKFLWVVEGKQGKDALSSLPGAAVGQETDAEEG